MPKHLARISRIFELEEGGAKEFQNDPEKSFTLNHNRSMASQIESNQLSNLTQLQQCQESQESLSISDPAVRCEPSRRGLDQFDSS